MTRGYLSTLKVREMERREQGGLKSHISFGMWKKKTVFLSKISVKQTYKIAFCLHNWFFQVVPTYYLLWGRAEIMGRAHRSSPRVVHQTAVSQICLYFQRKAIKPSKHTPFINSDSGASQIESTPFWRVRAVTNDQSVLQISQFPCPWCKHSVQRTGFVSSEVKLLYQIYHCRGHSAICFD